MKTKNFKSFVNESRLNKKSPVKAVISAYSEIEQGKIEKQQEFMDTITNKTKVFTDKELRHLYGRYFTISLKDRKMWDDAKWVEWIKDELNSDMIYRRDHRKQFPEHLLYVNESHNKEKSKND